MKLFTAALAALLGAAVVVPAEAAPFFTVQAYFSDGFGTLFFLHNLSAAPLHNVYISDPSPFVAIFNADPDNYGSNNTYPYGDYYVGNVGPAFTDFAPNSSDELYNSEDSYDLGYYHDDTAPLTISLTYLGTDYSVSFSPDSNDTNGFVPFYSGPSFDFVQVAHLDRIPEPASILLLSAGALCAAIVRRRRQTAL